jgi:alpha-N-arabinofuranosidase
MVSPVANGDIVIGPRHLGTISKYLFGANLLWADDAEGAFDAADGSFYPGFVRMLRRLDVTALRYPGGTTSDNFNWELAIGPQPDRRANEPYGMQASRLSSICCVLDGPQRSTVGPDEFGRLLDQTGAVGTITVNFATGTAREAADFVAYMTAPGSARPSSNPDEPSYWAALRAKNGHPAPYDVPYWEVGNEQLFPGQYGWRSGRVVSIGRHLAPCPPREVATCLYAFGGTTSFSGQRVGTFADELPSASYSTGAADQKFYVYFPPVVPGTAEVYVGGPRWSEVDGLATAGPRARVYTLDPSTGAVEFGDGTHGEVPPAGAEITVSYQSGPHGGFVQFYQAMKRMNSRISVCESEENDVAFLRLMGQKYPYDCVELHEYARPANFAEPLLQYEEGLMASPADQGAQLAGLQSEIRHYSGRNVPVLITEYGQLVAPVPTTDPDFNLSLDEGLLVGAQLTEWIDHGVPVAEKYLADSDPFLPSRLTRLFGTDDAFGKSMPGGDKTMIEEALSFGKAMVETGLSPDNAIVVHTGRQFVAEPAGEVLGLMSYLGGGERLGLSLVHDPQMGRREKAPELWAIAAVLPGGQLDLLVINASPDRSLRERILVGARGRPGGLRAYLLDGPSPVAFNTSSRPELVRVTASTIELGRGDLLWRFPAHSVTLLQWQTGRSAQRQPL